jgi:hypothetical protein
MPLDKLKKADKLQRNRSRQEEEWKNKDQVRCCAIRDTNSLLLSCHLEIGPKLMTPSL